jgi:cellulose synthase/poly-beta-1,6-N-acetylglucosamine synthase-like glycosyltransferase
MLLKKKIKCSIGVLCFNEAQNIERLLLALLHQQLQQVEITEIIVISSGSTDSTNSIVLAVSELNPLISLIIEKERNGKSAAINTFIRLAKNDILVIESGDTIPAETTIEKLVIPFAEESIGMTGGRPLPTNHQDSLIGYSVNLLWRMHHKMALIQPKLGEMIAFRKVFSSIPVESAVDEASIEAEIFKIGLKKKYIPEAIIHNKGPETISDFIKQRRRIASGHQWLKETEHYKVSSANSRLMIQLAFAELLENPFHIPFIIFTMKLELWARFLGWYDYKIKKRNPFKWETITTSKKLNLTKYD